MLLLKDIIKNMYAVVRRLPTGLRHKRFEIISTYFKVVIAYLVQSIIPKLGLYQQRVMGYKIDYFNPKQLLHSYEANFIQNEYYFRTNNPRPTIIDAGSNIGDSILYFKWLYPKCKIDAFEASPTTFSLLLKNVSQNKLSDVSLHNIGLSSKKGSAKIFINTSDPGSGLESLHRSSDTFRRLNKDSVSISTEKLSGFIKSTVDLLKIDVEGSEKEVLPEIARSGKFKYVKNVILEYHHHLSNNDNQLSGILRLLENSGFSYQLSTPLMPPFVGETFQDILIFGRKNP